MIHLDPKPLDLNKFRANPTIVLVAKRGSGKSTCIKNLMHHFDVNAHIPVGVVCSHSEDLDPFFSEFFPPAFIFNDCIKMLHKVLERQEKIKDENKKLINEFEATKLLMFTHFSNPLFILGTISLLFLNNSTNFSQSFLGIFISISSSHGIKP